MPYEILIGHPLVPVAEGSLTVGATATGIPAAQLDLAKGGEIEIHLGVETDQVRISYLAGGDPANNGILYDVGDKLRVSGPTQCRSMRLIRVTADATVKYLVQGKAI